MVKVWLTQPASNVAYKTLGRKPVFVINICVGRVAFIASWTRQKGMK